jgi:hypothetical protein
MRLKPNSVTEFIQTLQNEIDPLLRKEKGFRGHIAFVVPDGTEAVAISFWDRKESRISHNDERCEVLHSQSGLSRHERGFQEVHTDFRRVFERVFHRSVRPLNQSEGS